MEQKTWYAVYTHSRAEKKVAMRVQEKGIHVYLPLVKTLRQWSDRKKKVEIPLLSSYLFVYITKKEYYEVLQVPGIVGYVKFEGKAAAIRESQIEAMKMAIKGKMNIEVENKQLDKGVPVKIIAGPMKGAEGEYVETVQKRRFIIDLSSIGYSLKVEVDAADIMKI